MNLSELKNTVNRAYLLYQDAGGYVDKNGKPRSGQRNAIDIVQRLYHDKSITGTFRGKLGEALSVMRTGEKGDPYAMQKAERMLAKMVYNVSKNDLINDGGVTMNIKQQMNYHAREYRRLKAMTNDARTAISRIAIVARDANSARTARIEHMANQLMTNIDRLFDYGTEEQIKAKWPALKAKVGGFLRNYGSVVREDRSLMEVMNDLQFYLRSNSGKKPGRRME